MAEARMPAQVVLVKCPVCNEQVTPSHRMWHTEAGVITKRYNDRILELTRHLTLASRRDSSHPIHATMRAVYSSFTAETVKLLKACGVCDEEEEKE